VTTIYNIRPKAFNVGNDVIHLALRHLLDEAFGRIVNVISVPATSRYESHGACGLTAKTVYEINQYGDGVIVGGGNLYENGELQLDVEALARLEVPLLLYGLSWGRVYNRRGELVPRTDAMPDRTIRALNDRADYSLARDGATLAHLHAIGCARARLGGCPSIFLERSADRLPPVPAADRSGVLVSIRNPALMSVPPPVQARVRGQIEAVLDFLRREGHGDVRLLCHDPRDVAFATSFPDTEYVYPGDVYRYLGLLRSCQVCVSFRLHGTLPCLSYGRPVINVSYDERGTSAMQSVGMGEWDVNLVESADPVADVIGRYRRLAGLERLRGDAAATWAGHLETSLAVLRQFAERVAGPDPRPGPQRRPGERRPKVAVVASGADAG
jgi:hypothetical protein